jgi:hypothetical protein
VFINYDCNSNHHWCIKYQLSLIGAKQMAKPKPVYKIECFRDRGNPLTSTGTLLELIQYHKYTLECGASYSHEKGNKKINCNPKGIASLVTNLNNAVNNSAANGYAGKTYSYEELQDAVIAV